MRAFLIRKMLQINAKEAFEVEILGQRIFRVGKLSFKRIA